MDARRERTMMGFLFVLHTYGGKAALAYLKLRNMGGARAN